MPIRLVVVDDHNVVRQALRLFLSLDSDFEVVAEARDGAEAVQVVAEWLPDVVLMDLGMPVMDGIEATRLISAAHPAVRILALTSSLEDASVLGALRAGAVGYLMKDTEGDALRNSVRKAAAGETQLSPAALGALAAGVRDPSRPTLSDRESEVLRLVATGMANKEIAAALAIGERTVKFHVASVMSKLKVHSRTEAAMYAVRLGLASQRP